MRAAKTVREVLVAAKWIVQHIGWTKNGYGKKDGETLGWGDRDGDCFCAVGACGVVEAAYELREDARLFLNRACGSRSMLGFNDSRSTTKVKILQKFDEAIVLAGAA